MSQPQVIQSKVKSYVADFSSHKVSFILSPKQWNKFNLATSLKWDTQELDANNIARIPTTRGIYAHSIKIKMTNLPPTDFVTYIGLVGDQKKTGSKGNQRHLQQRFKEYLKETDDLGRPLVWGMLNQYKGFMCFHYAEVPDTTISLAALETALLDALLPPCNQEDFSINIKEAHQIVYRR